MGTVPKIVTARRQAMAAEYVEDVSRVITDGFTNEYFTTVGRPLLRLDCRLRRVPQGTPDSPELWRVEWLDVDRPRAAAAIAGDLAETFRHPAFHRGHTLAEEQTYTDVEPRIWCMDCGIELPKTHQGA